MLRGFVSLYELPMQIAAVLAAVLAVVFRLRTWLVLLGAAVAWLALEIGLAYHGWGVAPRYMFEPAAVLVVLAGAAVGRGLAADPRRPVPLRWLALAGVLVLAGTMVPHARLRGRLAHNGIVAGQRWARQIHRLQLVIAREGGLRRVLTCGQPVTTIPYQSIVAWELDQNVIGVGWEPRAWRALKIPTVVFEPVGAGWHVRAINVTSTTDPTKARMPASARITDTPLIRNSVEKFFAHAPAARTRLAVARANACARLAASTATS